MTWFLFASFDDGFASADEDGIFGLQSYTHLSFVWRWIRLDCGFGEDWIRLEVLDREMGMKWEDSVEVYWKGGTTGLKEEE